MGDINPTIYIYVTFTLLGLLVIVSLIGSIAIIIALNKLTKYLQIEIQPLSQRLNDLIKKIDQEVQTIHNTEVVVKVSNLMAEAEQLLHEARTSLSKIDNLGEDLADLAVNANSVVHNFEQKEVIARLAGVLDDLHRIAILLEKSMQKVYTWTDTTDRAIINIEDRLVSANKRLAEFNAIIDGVKAGFGAGVEALLHNTQNDRSRKLKSGEQQNEQKG